MIKRMIPQPRGSGSGPSDSRRCADVRIYCSEGRFCLEGTQGGGVGDPRIRFGPKKSAHLKASP